MITMIHGADFHLDSPFTGLTPQLAAQRRREQRELICRLVDLTLQRQADCLLLSGDLFDGQQIYPETVEGLSQELGRLSCPVFIAPGNHDYYSPRSPYATAKWSDNVHIFSTESVEAVELPEKNLVMYGAAFTAAHMEASPLVDVSVTRDDRVHVMTLHGALDGTDYAPIAQETIAKSGLHYLALGHIHQHSGLQKAGGTYYAYPGCPQGRGFDELGEKGVLCVTVEEGNCESEFIPLCARRYEIVSVDVTDEGDISQAIRRAIPQDTDAHSYRIRLTGTARQLDVKGLEQELAPQFFSLSLRDETRPPMEIWGRKGEDSLVGLFLQEMAAQGAETNPDLQLALRYGLAALEQREDVSP